MFGRKRASGKVVYYATAMLNGEQYCELVGTDKREATRVEARIKREIRVGAFQPKALRTGSVTAGRYAATWGAQRDNRTASDDRQRLRDDFVVHFGDRIQMNQITEREALAFVRWCVFRCIRSAVPGASDQDSGHPIRNRSEATSTGAGQAAGWVSGWGFRPFWRRMDEPRRVST